MNPFPPDALEANRRGELTDMQLSGFRGLSRYRRKSALSTAGLLAAGALLIDFYAAPTLSAVSGVLINVICFAIAAFLVVRSISGGDALTRDLRRMRVDSKEGAIGKSRVSIPGEGNLDLYYLEVGDSSFNVMPMTFDAAPDAGYVRLYFLPYSRKVVNLERLPDRPTQQSATVQDIARCLGTAVMSHDRRMRNEARANMVGIRNATKAAFAQPTVPTPEARDPRPLREAIVGTWSNGVVTAKFSADGTVTMRVLGREKLGRWSVDVNGRLRSDITGQQQVVEAWVASQQLIISAEGEGLTLIREP